ncbi:hypothetical protein GN244_ATG02395 [Phytophthora infestans]|nr:hypothetical protein GN244_ATG02395 [Phytophthora infestans]
MFCVYLILYLFALCSVQIYREWLPSSNPLVLTSPRLSLLSQQQAPCIASLAAMISPLKDIVIATVLGIGAGMVWNNFKDGELDRIGQFYKWYDAQEAQKKSLHADD